MILLVMIFALVPHISVWFVYKRSYVHAYMRRLARAAP